MLSVVFALLSVSCPIAPGEAEDQEPDVDLDIMVGPEGGTFDIDEGLLLYVPAGAVQKHTPIGVRRGDIKGACQLLSAFSLEEEDVIAYIEAFPDGQTFDVPIVFRMSDVEIDQGDRPLVHLIDMKNGLYQPGECKLTLNPSEHSAQLSVSHFTGWLVPRPPSLEQLCSAAAVSRAPSLW
jgi:hypothetical protein